MIVSRSLSFVVAAAGMASAASVASAAFEVPNGTNFPWTRGTTNYSAYAEWNTFAQPLNSAHLPDVGSSNNGPFAGNAPAWNVAGSGPLAIITSTGNIYGGFDLLTGSVTIPGFGLGTAPSASTIVLVQLRTIGTEVNPASINLDGILPTSVTNLTAVGGVERIYRFDLSGSASGYTFNLVSATQNMGIDRVAVDIYSVPAPASAALLGLGGLIAARRRRA